MKSGALVPTDPLQGVVYRKGTQAWADALRAKTKECHEHLEYTFLALGKLLYFAATTHVDDDPDKPGIYVLWGYRSFGDYVQTELGISTRQADNLKSAWYHLDVELAGLDPDLRERLLRLGLSKVRTLCAVLTQHNVADWLTLAEKHTVRELEVSVRVYRRRRAQDPHSPEPVRPEPVPVGEEEESPPPSYRPTEAAALPGPPPAPPEVKLYEVSVSLFPDQVAVFQSALSRARELTKSSSRAYNLTMALQDFLLNNTFLGDPQLKRAHYLAKLEDLLGVKIVAFSKDFSQILHGVESLRTVVTHLENPDAKLAQVDAHSDLEAES